MQAMIEEQKKKLARLKGLQAGHLNSGRVKESVEETKN